MTIKKEQTCLLKSNNCYIKLGHFFMNNEIMWVQCTKKVVSDSPRLMDFAIEL